MVHQFTFCRGFYLLNSQWYNIDNKILYKNNKRSIKLVVNGKKSAGNRIYALNTGFLFRTYQVGKGNLHIKYFPTDKMWGYFITNPNQGEKFKNFRNHVLGVNE